MFIAHPVLLVMLVIALTLAFANYISKIEDSPSCYVPKDELRVKEIEEKEAKERSYNRYITAVVLLTIALAVSVVVLGLVIVQAIF